MTSLRFQGFESFREVVLLNAGGGRLEILAALRSTDEGLPWLSSDGWPAPPIPLLSLGSPPGASGLSRSPSEGDSSIGSPGPLA